MAALRAGSRCALIMLVPGFLFVLAGCSSTGPTPDISPTPERVPTQEIAPTPEADVMVDLTKEDWKYTPGVTVVSGGLQVSATGRSIVDQDGGGGQPNPPPPSVM